MNLLTNAGLVYFFIRRENQQRRRPRIFQIANALGITRRTVWGHLNSKKSPLIKRGYVSIERKGRKGGTPCFFVTNKPLLVLRAATANENEFEENLFFLTSHGITLTHIEMNPGITIKEIAQKRCLTRRSVWGIIGDLRRAGLIRVRKEGRKHHYFFNDDKDLFARLEEEALEELSVRKFNR